MGDYSRACSPSEALFVLKIVGETSQVAKNNTQFIQITREANILSIFPLGVKILNTQDKVVFPPGQLATLLVCVY